MKKLTLLSVAVCVLITLLISACSPAPSSATKLRVACDATWPPFEIINEQTKELDGYGPELIRAVAARAGLDIELVNV
ncbi:MAG: transporter substrate-binding domain-containing protein, partial [Dehalococcoidia bacterium]|nr:transporter substrate-binding domain-containing protein [Dehalococcoidia bacterium]